VIFCKTCGLFLFSGNPLNDDGVVILIHAMAGHELEVRA
jgi:hypothetical protein